ncbi:gamma carbonic anhydrase family protein [Devosia algicola]|uniref:Gamma carbonic anhydrase family protein n=1 Tax=Devosia algicola TaxID=3026418 RepID=A0ABY7YMG6_9HYPH|nr:gamma carbonic anhydrase family protein [Devosia algicola]WDR02130.1 gamma carbonic anhydrase family protein [Devosia algicola]
MTQYALDGVSPNIDPDVAWIAPTAILVGKINIARDVGIWFGVVARGDNEPITIGARTNIQENTVLHTDMGFPLTVGAGCTIGHKAMLHGCTIGDNSLIGMGATVLNGATIGNNCLIGAGALITEGKTIPDNSLVVGAPGKVVRELDADAIAKLTQSADHYVVNAQRFAEGCRPATKHELNFDPT